MSTRDLVQSYLTRRISRRTFTTRLVTWGFSSAAATSILHSLTPLLSAKDNVTGKPESLKTSTSGLGRKVEGTGGELLVAQLHAAGVRFIFNCNSSRTYPIFDALVDRPDMKVIQVSQEGQMISLAQGYTLGSGDIAFAVTPGVGLPNTLSNLYNAWKDRSPLVVASVREESQALGGRDAFEDWDDFLSPSSAFTRSHWDVGQTERIPEFTRRAFRVATTAPQGPVTLAFPVDTLAAPAKATLFERERFILPPEIKASPHLVEQAAELLLRSKNPLILVGSEVSRSNATPDIARLAEQLSIPVTQGERLLADFPTDHELFIGERASMPGPEKIPDLILSFGSRLPGGRISTSDATRTIHFSLDPESIARVAPTDVGAVADVREAAKDLLACIEGRATTQRLQALRAGRLDQIRSASADNRSKQLSLAKASWNNNPISWDRIGGELELALDRDAIVVSELDSSGYHGLAANAVLSQMTFSPQGRLKIGKSIGSALGWGVGTAAGVQLAQPNRQVACLQGDGGILFGQIETLWTLARYEIPVLIIVFNNRCYNGPLNRIMDEGGRQAVTGKNMICHLGNPDIDFAGAATAFGVRSETVSDPNKIQAALRRGIEATREGRPYLLEAIVEKTGPGSKSTWYPTYSVAAQRQRKT